jgi:ABC-type transport system involved in multi-copper enzyme maturation permease subunit
VILHNPFNPIFEKELRATSRRKRSYVLRVVYLGGLLLFLLLAYLGTGDSSVGGGIAWRVQRQNMLGRVFFFIFSIFCVGSMAMIGPVLTSTAISAERLHKSLHVLLMTPITSWQIITGKLFSRLLVAFTLIGLSLPVLALVRLLGGVELEQMLGILTLATATAIVTAALGLFLSTFINRAYATLLFAYGSILLVWVFAPVMVLVVDSSWSGAGPPGTVTIRLVSTISPFFCTGLLASPAGPMVAASWAWCAGLQLGLAAVLVCSSAWMLRRLQRSEGSSATTDSPGDQPAALSSAHEQDPQQPIPQAAGSGPRRRTRPEVGDNPVLWRELSRPLFPRRWQLRVAAAALGVVLIAAYGILGYGSMLHQEELQVVFGCVFNGLAWLVVGVLAATAITQEKESDTWTLLLASPISGRAILFGKILGLGQRMFWPLMLLVVHLVIFTLANVISWLAAAFVIWIIITFNALWVATGMYLSVKLQKVTSAVIANLSIAVVLYVLLPILLVISGLIIASRGDDWAEVVLWGLPYYYIVEGIDSFSPNIDWERTFNAPAPLPSLKVKVFLLMGFLVGAAHLLLAGAVVAMTIRRFDRIVGRARQRAAW